MNSVRCPICEQRMTAGDSAGLSAELRGHLSDQHDIKVQEKSARFTSPMTSARERPEEPTSGGRHEERGLRGMQHRREEQAWAPEAGSPVPPRPEGTGDWMRKSLGTNPGAGGREEWARGQGYPSQTERASERSTSGWPEAERPRERAVPYMECPMCGERVTGWDEPELSRSLELHFREAHRIVPRVTSR